MILRGISTSFEMLSPDKRQVAYALRTRLPLCIATPFDLHVLGPPLAFILSQDQTLHCIVFNLPCISTKLVMFVLLIPLLILNIVFLQFKGSAICFLYLFKELCNLLSYLAFGHLQVVASLCSPLLLFPAHLPVLFALLFALLSSLFSCPICEWECKSNSPLFTRKLFFKIF